MLEGVWLEDSQMECENVGSSEPGLQREIVEMRERERGTERERERERVFASRPSILGKCSFLG